MLDKQCEELAFPVLFPKGRYGYTTEGKLAFLLLNILMQDLYIAMEDLQLIQSISFFQFIIEQKKVSDSINIALKKVHGQSLTASELRGNSQRLVNLSLYLSRSGILILVPNRRYCTVLAKINV